jgi:general secretion pathway protein C
MLDRFFEKYTWTANALLLFAAAWLAARTVNTVVGAVIRPEPKSEYSSAPAAQTVRTAALAQIEADKLYPLIGQKAPAVAPEGGDEAGGQAPTNPQNCLDSNAAPVKSSLGAQLVAGIISDHPEYSLASILDLSSREVHLFQVGDAFQGAKLISVERVREDTGGLGTSFRVIAVVCNNGTKEFIDFEPGDGSSRPTGPNLGVFNPPPADPGNPVSRVSDNRYSVPKSYVDGALTNMNAIATQARIVPSFKNGVGNGFKIFSIQPNSLYSNIGVENGDVLQRINGYDINSPDKALEVYSKLRESNHVTLEIERNGQVIRKDYTITP